MIELVDNRAANAFLAAGRVQRCRKCGSRLRPCPARFDGEDTYVGFYACPCDDARDEDVERDEWAASRAAPTPGDGQ